MEQITVYEQDGFQVVTSNQEIREQLVIFFADRDDNGRRSHTKNTAKKLAQKPGVVTAHVTGPDQGWFQDAAALRLFDALASLAAKATKVTLVGQRMGAYGALRMAGIHPVDHVIAFSPVASIDPRTGPEDWRFDEDFAALGECARLMTHKAARYTVFYDPGSIEKRHLAHLGLPGAATDRVVMPASCGAASWVLHDGANLVDVLLALMDGVTGAALGQIVRDARRSSPLYLRLLATSNLDLRPGVALWALGQMRSLNVRPAVSRRLERMLQQAAPDLVA